MIPDILYCFSDMFNLYFICYVHTVLINTEVIRSRLCDASKLFFTHQKASLRLYKEWKYE